MSATARAAVCTARQRLVLQEQRYLLEPLHTLRFAVTEAELALHSAIVPNRSSGEPAWSRGGNYAHLRFDHTVY